MSARDDFPLSTSEADIVRAALDQVCDGCRGLGNDIARQRHDGSNPPCLDCDGSGKRPAETVYLVVEGDRHAGPGAFVGKGDLLIYSMPSRWAQHDTECETCAGKGDLLPSSGDWRWCPSCRGTGRTVVTLTVECGRCCGLGSILVIDPLPRGSHEEPCPAKCYDETSGGSVPLATATVRVLPVRRVLDPIDDQDEIVVEQNGRCWFQTAELALPTIPRPGIDWVVCLDLQEGP